ncbi:hypothetical protein [Bacillus weihaiensis]|uniref:hypothetical protein n=1 Tax=Bacillus weihaiensis TaxID=1547283 RepID=UPI00235461CE|nr:hypothetical protein [Bacillus weihaiensis]
MFGNEKLGTALVQLVVEKAKVKLLLDMLEEKGVIDRADFEERFLNLTQEEYAEIAKETFDLSDEEAEIMYKED